jgi:hypothetical protein
MQWYLIAKIRVFGVFRSLPVAARNPFLSRDREGAFSATLR